MLANTLFREAEIESGADTTTGTIRLSFASELPVLRKTKELGTFYEVLPLSDGQMDLSLLNSQGIVLENHNERLEIGTVVKNSARVDADLRARATISIYSPEWQRKIADGWRGGVSIGYRWIDLVKETRSEEDGIRVLHFSTQVFEISLLTVEPADNSVGLYRQKSNMKNNNPSVDQLLSLALSASRRGYDANSFTREALVEEYSIIDLINGFYKGNIPSLQKRVSESVTRLGGEVLFGHYVPFMSLLPRRRDLQATVFGAGGALVQSDLQPAVELLFNKLVAIPLGCEVVSGLTGNYVAPRVVSSPTPASVSEIAAAVAADLAFDQIALPPCRVTVQVVLSKQLLVQSDDAAEDIVRKTVSDALAAKIDGLILNGAGAANEPQGILNTPGIGSVVFGGAASWLNVTAFEKSLADQSADIGRLGWAVSPATRLKWKNASRASGTSTQGFIMERGQVSDYPAAVTASLSGNNLSVFGNWSNLALLIWGDGVDCTIDPVTQAPRVRRS